MCSMRPVRDEHSRTGEDRSRCSGRLRTRVYPLVACGALLLLSLGQHLSAQPPWEACDSTAGVSESLVGRWRSFLTGHSTLSADELVARSGEVVDETMAVDVMAREILRSDWEELRPAQRTEFLTALRISLRNGIVSLFEGDMGGVFPALTPTGTGDDPSVVEYSLAVPGGRTRELTLHLAAVDGTRCKIVDVEYDGDELLKKLRDRVSNLIDEYSYPYMIAKLADRDHMTLDDFESSPLGEFPAGWGQREDDDEPPYRVREEDGNRYLEATDEGESVIIGLETPWNLDEYPYISFRLRVNRIPEGANERDDQRVDSAAGVYVTIKKVAFGRIPESVKYVWSSTLPVGAATRREGIGRPWQIVIGSGQEGLGEWRTYVFDLREAYRRTFGGDPGRKPAGIGVLSDANSMKAQAYADYDDFKALKHAPEGTTGGVVERLRPLRRRD